jgi:hypothetical protein
MRIRTNVRGGERPIKNSKTGLMQAAVNASVRHAGTCRQAAFGRVGKMLREPKAAAGAARLVAATIAAAVPMRKPSSAQLHLLVGRGLISFLAACSRRAPNCGSHDPLAAALVQGDLRQQRNSAAGE